MTPRFEMAFSAFLLLLGGCATNNTGTGTTGGASTDTGNGVAVVFPHPADWSLPQKHGVATLTPGSQLAPERCNGCHDLNSDTREGDGAPGCRNCHAAFPHPDGWGIGSLHVQDLASAPDGLSAGITTKCATTCHGTDLAGGLSGVACNRCHSGYPHPAGWSDAASHGIAVISSSTGGLPACKTCHGQTPAGGTFAVSCLRCHSLPDGTKPVQHKPSQTGSCASCHASRPADAQGPHLLLQSAPALCTGCHPQGRSLTNYKHSPLTAADSCLGCHLPHDGTEAGLLKAPQKDLCLTCHNRDLTSAQYGTTRNMQAVSAGSSNLHPPFAKSECAACHDVHGSANNHLLSSPDPMFWIPNGVDAKSFSCFGCHDQGTYLLNGTYPRPASVTRPNSALPTQFVAFPSTTPATAKNLHFSHVVEAGAGCLACHDPHGNDNSHLLRPYFTYTDPGSGFWSRTSCKGCHNGQIPPDLNSLW